MKLELVKPQESFLTYYTSDGAEHTFSYTENGYVNVTEMAKIFGKDQFDFFRHKTAVEYIQALSRSTGIPESELKYVVQGGNQRESHRSENSRNGEFAENSPNKGKVDQGTFCHPKLAIRFAQWLNADFAVWVDGKILEIINPTPSKTNEAPLVLIARALAVAEEAIRTQGNLIEVLKPKAETWDKIVNADGLITFQEASAKFAIREMGQNNLFRFAKKIGLIINSTTPYRKHVEAGRLVLRVTTYQKPDGSDSHAHKLYLTGKGLEYLYEHLVREGYNPNSTWRNIV